MNARVQLAALAVATLAMSGTVAASADTTTSYGGFSTQASATPLRLEVHEPAIPIPADPQVELNFSFTSVAGSSGPTGSARASALWPGSPVGEGLKTIVEQAGLPRSWVLPVIRRRSTPSPRGRRPRRPRSSCRG